VFPSDAAAAERPIEQIEAELCELSASIAAAQGRFLRLLGELLERDGNARWEVLPPRWVSWKLGLGSGEARRLVGLAERLRALPTLLEACEAGTIAPSLAGLISRVATPDTEADLVALAGEAAPAKVERICRTKARIDADKHAAQRQTAEGDADGEPPAAAPAPPQQRYLSFGPAEGGGWEIHGWLPSEEGARFELALGRARTWLRGAGKPPYPEAVAAVCRLYDTAGWVDALLVVGETVLAGGVRERRACDRHQVIVHTDLDTLAEVLNGGADPAASVAYTANGAALDAAGLARIACTSRLIGLVKQAGRPVRIGDPTEVVPIHIERAVLARHDHTCAHPLCGATRGLELHHVIYRSHGGLHDPDYLVPLCGGDHLGHHAGAFTITTTDTPGQFRFFARDGTEITGRPPPRHGDPPPLPPVADPTWAHNRPYGDPLTIWSLDVILNRLYDTEEAAAAAQAAQAAQAAEPAAAA
jgi:hypothetical protein